MSKPSPKLDWKARLVGAALRALMTPMMLTCRVQVEQGGEHLDRLREGGGPVIFTCWHDRLFFLTHFLHRHLAKRGVPISALVSRSRDGDFGDTLGTSLGARIIRGSSSRGGSTALRALVQEVRQGRNTVMVVDGPKGPPHQPKPGAVTLARLTGAPLLPLAWRASRSWYLSTWDRLEIPKPGSRVTVYVGDPIEIPREAHAEEISAVTAEMVYDLHFQEPSPAEG